MKETPNIQLAICAVILVITVAIAIAGLVICIVFEIQCNRLDREIKKKQQHRGSFSDIVEAKLDMEWN